MRPEFAPMADPVGLGANNVVLVQTFLQVFRFSAVSVIAPLLRIYACITWGMDNGHGTDHSSTKTQFCPIVKIIITHIHKPS